MDLSPLIKGVMAIIGIALALGQYPKLKHWAREQVIEALEFKQELPDLFPEARLNGHKINEIVRTREPVVCWDGVDPSRCRKSSR